MRIAYVTDIWPSQRDGVAGLAERRVDWLREHDRAVDLIRPRQHGEAPGESGGEWRVTGWTLPALPGLRLAIGLAGALRARFREQRRQIVHVATQGALGRAAVAAAASLGLPLTSDFCSRAPVQRRGLRRLHNRCNRTFVPTQALCDQLAQQGFERVERIGRGVDPMLFWPGRRSAALRVAWGAADNALVMLYVGRLAPEKNVELALRAFDAIRYLRPDTRMVVVGDGPQRARLQAQFPAARFVGIQHGEALAAHYASADLCLLPNRAETFGTITLEALASGLALVAFDAGAAAEHVRSDCNGVLVEREDEDGFIAAAARAAAQAEPQSTLRLRARESALGDSWDAALRHFDSRLLRLALDGRGAVARGVALA